MITSPFHRPPSPPPCSSALASSFQAVVSPRPPPLPTSSIAAAPQPLSLPLNLTAWPYFCSLVMSPSPCLTTSAYCLFLSSGRFVSMILLTRSMVQGMRSAAMNFARSLCVTRMGLVRSRKKRKGKGGRIVNGQPGETKVTYRSRKSTETPKSCAMLPRPTTR